MGKPKALVKYGEKSFLETVIGNFQNAGLEEIIVVLGFAAEDILAKLRLPSVQIVIKENYSLGQLSSFQAGLGCLGSDVDGVFLALVD